MLTILKLFATFTPTLAKLGMERNICEPNIYRFFLTLLKVDQQLGSFATSTECRGGAELIVLPHRLLGALRISGWAWNSRDGRPVDKVISSRNGIVSGRFAVGAWLPAVRAAHRGINNSYIGFEGYVPENETRAKITLYAILPGNPPTACPFATIDPLNVVKEAR